ncbi:MAG: glycoside hydrolase [Bacteroides sp.]|nr:glycoside hydrolase [Bacteroides sp.]MCM1447859.1 glycoside hydrolase [Bacteroides sp.]
MKDYVKTSCGLALSLLTLSAMPLKALADTVKVNVHLEGKTRYPKTNRWMGVLEVQAGDRKSLYTVQADQAGTTITFDVPAGAPFSLKEACKLHGYDLGRIEQDGDVWNVIYVGDGKGEYQYLWYNNEKTPYRIPSIVTLRNGKLLALNDERPCGADIGYGRVDQVMRIGSKDGRKWERGRYIIQGSYSDDGIRDDGFGDPAMVVDRETGTVLLLMVCGHTVCWHGNYPDGEPNPVARLYSTDNGKTWGDAIDGRHSVPPQGAMCAWSDITDKIYGAFVQRGEEGFDQYRVQSLFVGSGKLTQSKIIKNGTHYRVYAPVWTKNHGNRVLYTDDFGQTWHALGGKTALPCLHGDEPKCEELPDGSVLLSSRKSAGRYYNIYKYADESAATGTWGECVASNEEKGGISCGRNSTNGEILIMDVKKKSDGTRATLALQSLPTADGRADVKVYWKDITEPKAYSSPKAFTGNWNQNPYQVSHAGSAYSTMTLQKDGRIGFYYEEEPGCYSLVYVPLSIETITNNLYTNK